MGVPALDADRYALAMLVLNVSWPAATPADEVQLVLALCGDVIRPPISTIAHT